MRTAIKVLITLFFLAGAFYLGGAYFNRDLRDKLKEAEKSVRALRRKNSFLQDSLRSMIVVKKVVSINNRGSFKKVANLDTLQISAKSKKLTLSKRATPEYQPSKKPKSHKASAK
jgi:hypothetical protein